MTPQDMKQAVENLSEQMDLIKEQLAITGAQAAEQIHTLSSQVAGGGAAPDFFINALTVLVLAGFVGYYVIWNVTPALYAPLMAVSNAISSVMIVGAMIAAGTNGSTFAGWMGFAAVVLASVNFFGGWVISDRMLAMFKKKKKEAN